MDIKIIADKVVEVGRLVHVFGSINRATFYEDGITPESDTDHTVMLGTIACAIAYSYNKDLDIGKVAQFALVHDLVEAYAGDVPTLNISTETLQLKEQKEHEPLQRIKKEFDDVFPWISKTIEEYESLNSPEATFVKTLDKCMPKITHVLNKGVTIKNYFDDEKSARASFDSQNTKLRNSYGAQHALLMDLHAQLASDTFRRTYGE